MQLLKPFPQSFIKRLRLSNPWNYKVPFLIAIPYFFIMAGSMSFGEASLSVFYSLLTIIGIAGFGYLSNDVGDRDADRKAGKPNIALELNRWQIVSLLIFFVAIALLPWIIYFPMDEISFLLLFTQFILFITYTSPPFRLKEKGFAGVITDALYAHVNPALLAAYTFHLLSGKSYLQFDWFLIALAVWQFFLGIRNILLHQIKDADNDRLSGIRTFVTGRPEVWISRLMRKVVIPLEVLSFIAFLAPVSIEFATMAIAYPLFLLYTGMCLMIQKKNIVPVSYRERLYVFLDDFYTGWIPVLILSGLSVENYRMALLLCVHLFLFKNPLFGILSNLVGLISTIALRLPQHVNKHIK
ncbi:MAG TPA: UbiA family prenyltransferase [Chitinophagaceae bacterium]